MMSKKMLLWILLSLLGLVISCTLTGAGETTPVFTATSRPLPTYTPFPTYTPLPPMPTYTPFPTYTPSAVKFADVAQDTSLAEAINEYRAENGVGALRISYYLMNMAASRVYLTMLPGVDLGVVQIDSRAMPSNYAWSEWTLGGNDELALSINTPEAVIKDMVERRGASEELLSEEYRDVGAVLLCNGERCGYVIILGRPYP